MAEGLTTALDLKTSPVIDLRGKFAQKVLALKMTLVLISIGNVLFV
jgi:hypothetical protein